MRSSGPYDSPGAAPAKAAASGSALYRSLGSSKQWHRAVQGESEEQHPPLPQPVMTVVTGSAPERRLSPPGGASRTRATSLQMYTRTPRATGDLVCPQARQTGPPLLHAGDDRHEEHHHHVRDRTLDERDSSSIVVACATPGLPETATCCWRSRSSSSRSRFAFPPVAVPLTATSAPSFRLARQLLHRPCSFSHPTDFVDTGLSDVRGAPKCAGARRSPLAADQPVTSQHCGGEALDPQDIG
jgi:hypothetical protein